MMARTIETNNSSGSGKIMVQQAPKWQQQEQWWLHHANMAAVMAS